MHRININICKLRHGNIHFNQCLVFHRMHDCTEVRNVDKWKINEFQYFKKDGSFDQINNSQIQDTVTAVLCFGDPRHLDFTIHQVTQRKIEKICKSKSFDLTHGSLFVLHPNDEKPLVRPFCSKNEPSFFKHSCKGVARGQMSLGIVLRSVSHFCQVDKRTGCAVSDVSDGARRSIADNAVITYFNDKRKKEDENRFRCVWNMCKNKHFNWPQYMTCFSCLVQHLEQAIRVVVPCHLVINEGR